MNTKEMYKQAYSDRRNRCISHEQFYAFWGSSEQRIIISELAIKSFVKRNHEIKSWESGIRFLHWRNGMFMREPVDAHFHELELWGRES
jgi:hypothetical protein